jgi:hypothetical protein
MGAWAPKDLNPKIKLQQALAFQENALPGALPNLYTKTTRVKP